MTSQSALIRYSAFGLIPSVLRWGGPTATMKTETMQSRRSARPIQIELRSRIIPSPDSLSRDGHSSGGCLVTGGRVGGLCRSPLRPSDPRLKVERHYGDKGRCRAAARRREERPCERGESGRASGERLGMQREPYRRPHKARHDAEALAQMAEVGWRASAINNRIIAAVTSL